MKLGSTQSTWRSLQKLPPHSQRELFLMKSNPLWNPWRRTTSYRMWWMAALLRNSIQTLKTWLDPLRACPAPHSKSQANLFLRIRQFGDHIRSSYQSRFSVKGNPTPCRSSQHRRCGSMSDPAMDFQDTWVRWAFKCLLILTGICSRHPWLKFRKCSSSCLWSGPGIFDIHPYWNCQLRRFVSHLLQLKEFEVPIVRFLPSIWLLI